MSISLKCEQNSLGPIAFTFTFAFGLACSLAAALLPSSGFAQTTYRCGNTFSQTPCAADAKPNRISGSAAADPAPGSTGEELCAASAPAALHFADPESARIKSVARAGAQAILYADKPTVSHRFDMIINARNANGAYAGDRLFACFLSEDEHRVLKWEASTR